MYRIKKLIDEIFDSNELYKFHDVIYNTVNFGPCYPLNNYLTIRISTLLRITYCIPCLFKVDIKLKGSFCCQVYIQTIYYIYECVTLCARTYFIHLHNHNIKYKINYGKLLSKHRTNVSS